MADLVWSDPDPEKEDFAISPRFVELASGALIVPDMRCHRRGVGYTFGSGVVYKFLETNKMTHILRAHQLCMEGYASLFDKHLSTVWSAPNYCYRCGNSASILEVGPGESMFFNVFQAAPENERDGPSQQAAQNAGGKVCQLLARQGALSLTLVHSYPSISCKLSIMIDTLPSSRKVVSMSFSHNRNSPACTSERACYLSLGHPDPSEPVIGSMHCIN